MIGSPFAGDRILLEDIINARPDLSMVVGLWNYNGPAIVAAIEALGKKGKVLAVAFDEDDGTLDGIANGTIQAAVVQKPFQFGYLSSKWMHELATKGQTAKASLPPTHIIDTGVDLDALRSHFEYVILHQAGRIGLEKQARSTRSRNSSVSLAAPAAFQSCA